MHQLRVMITAIFLLIGIGLTAHVAEAGPCLLSGMGREVCVDSAENEQPLYLDPESAEDTLFGQRWYGRLADFADIYPEPTRASTPLRNVGDGYVFASIITRVTNDADEVWYMINFGEYIHEDDIIISEVSEFQGITLSRQPERPFAWVVQEVRPSSEPEGEPNPNFTKLKRYDRVEIFDAVLGDDDWVWYNIGDGRWVRQTQFSIVNIAEERPEGVGPNDYWTEIDLFEQTMMAYEGDQLVFATLISSGLNQWPTTEGLYQVALRLREYKMDGSEGFPDYYNLEDIPYIMYFNMDRGIALHGTYWHDAFGYKQSHGCVNLSVQDAEWTYTWSANAPDDLWVNVYTSDPKAPFESETQLESEE